MEKRKESSDSMYKWEMDILSSGRLNLLEKNTHLQELLSKKDNEVDTPLSPMNDSSQIISETVRSRKFILREGIPLESGGAEAVPLSQKMPLAPAIPIVASSLMSPMLIYFILTLLLIAIIWLVVRKW